MNEENTQNENVQPGLSPIRTFGDDVKNIVQQDNISTSKIFMAEQKKREQEEEVLAVNDIKQTPNIIKTSLSIVLILLGLGSIFFAITFLLPKIEKNNPVQVVIEKNSFFDVNAIQEIDISILTKREALAKIREAITLNSKTNEGEILKIKIVKEVEIEENGKISEKKVEINTFDFFNLIEARVPDVIVRNLGNEFLLGTHRVFGKDEPFIILLTQDRDLIYAGMFEWEDYLIADIRDLFFTTLGSSNIFNESIEVLNSEQNQPTATTTATSSTMTQNQYDYNPLNFVDIILNNKDTRAITNKNNNILFFYSLSGSKNLVFANNVETFKVLISKMNNASVIK